METSQIKEIASQIGDSVSGLTNGIISWMNERGIITSPITSKIITIILLLLGVIIIIKFLENLKPAIKYAIIGLLIVLIGCIAVSFI